MSYHGGSDFETPNINALAGDALELTHYYVQHYCTPTRSALMSGRYPMRDGLQQYIIQMMAAYGMPLDVPTIPQHLKTAGYSTHLIGSINCLSLCISYVYTHQLICSSIHSVNGISVSSIPHTLQLTVDSIPFWDIMADLKTITARTYQKKQI